MKRWIQFAISFSFAAVVILTAAQADLPAGKGKEVVERMCTNCHGLDQVTATRYAKKYWGTLVDDMVSKGAEGSEEDVNLVISYLSRNFGKPVNINASTAKEIETGLSFTPAESELVVKYRTDKGAFKTFEDLQKVAGVRADILDEQRKNIVF
jgi:competence ComEA-like helix-hairpin-helix protein